LTKTQKLGLQYYEDIQKRIPRTEMKAHEDLLLGELPQGMKGTIVGSYRRGAETSGDIDMLITMDVGQDERTRAFHAYVKGLRDKGYIVEELSKGDQKHLSIVRLAPDATARRLDLLVIPVEQFPYALLYFTGSSDFNVGFRRHALKQGYTLNEHEMKPKEKSNAKDVPSVKTEEDVFAFLGLEYKEPKERTGASAVTLKRKEKWVQKVSKTTGKPYWYNRETKESVWEKPANARGGTRRSRRS
jgi:DNA polymerase beta